MSEMTLIEKVLFLQEVELLSSLSPEQLGRIARIAREIQIGQQRVANRILVGLQIGRRQKSLSAVERDVVVLADPVTAGAQTSGKHAVFVHRHAAGQEDDAVLVCQVDLFAEISVRIE